LTRLIIHIGTTKTGSSSIQTVLGRNRKMLSKNGIIYPNIDGSNTHNLLPAAFRRSEQQWAYHRKLYGNNPKKIVSAALNAWDRLAACVAKSPEQTFVLSSEGFSLLSETEAFQAFLSEKLPGLTPEIVVYLRHPVEWVQSNLFQSLRRTTNVIPPMPLGWSDMLDRWANVGPLTVRSMEPDRLLSGDAVSDFLHAVLGLKSELVQNMRHNVSLSAEGAILVHDFRRVLQPDRNEERTEEVRAMISELMKIESLPEFIARRSKIRLRPEWRSTVIDQIKDDITAIKTRQGFRFSDDQLYANVRSDNFVQDAQVVNLRDVIEYDQTFLIDLQARLIGELLPAQMRQSHRGISHGLPMPLRRVIWAGLRRMRMLR